ncbi:hypothetical protein [Acinetobacter bereziniae]|uniref:hypothetical protein n=1 Tax=Acinetobacter bereziniae TaxID=106648 RepID=UPI00124FD10C|nr:hypothetical protein [Acinetobacter bereziniae]MCU4321769.1 hypothetical protein [Acinetobacter bereziniae]
MPTLAKIQQVTEIALLKYPETHARYKAGDRTVTAQLNAIQHMLVEIGRDIDVSEIEPFIKSREATILADASNKGILPYATPCQHNIEITNRGTERTTINSGRVFEDGQGRPWRFLQNAEVHPNTTVSVLAEQSQIRKIEKTITDAITFNQFMIEIEDDMSLVNISVIDQDQNQYWYVSSWMNCLAGDYAFTLKTNSLRNITLEFGDSERFGRTLEANTKLSIGLMESYGEIDTTALKEAMLQQVNNNYETKLLIKFAENGLVRMGANPLSIDQMRLLASYPTHDDNAVFLGNFEFLVRKKFMARCHYLNVWNESIHEQFYGASVKNINHLFVTVVPKNPSEYELICEDIRRVIARADNLYSGDKVVFIEPEERPYDLKVVGTVSSAHDLNTLKSQIKTLLISNYGKEQIASSYNLTNGFNLQEISKLMKDNIPAFQDRQSNFYVVDEELSVSPIKPNQWVYINAESIKFNITRLRESGGGLWSVY